jgi:hypothetical protein
MLRQLIADASMGHDGACIEEIAPALALGCGNDFARVVLLSSCLCVLICHLASRQATCQA